MAINSSQSGCHRGQASHGPKNGEQIAAAEEGVDVERARLAVDRHVEDGEVPEPQTRTEFRGDYVRALDASARVTAVDYVQQAAGSAPAPSSSLPRFPGPRNVLPVED